MFVDGTCLPRWSTPRTKSRPTWGPYVGKVSAKLGTPFMPWQQHILNVALECNDDGRLVYRDVRITVPRQSGKTTLVLPVVYWRVLAASKLGGRQHMVYCAQTRQKARKKWEREYVYRLMKRGMITKENVRFTNGDEHVMFPENDSTFGIDSTTEKAGHGDTLDMGILDEAFALPDDRMDQALRPPMLTRPSPQVYIVSTAGNKSSVYLRDKVEQGRLCVENGITHGTCYFEWSADPMDDPDDEDVWRGCMPALGRTVSIEAIRAERLAMKNVAEFSRAYLNVWPEEQVNTVIPISDWNACKLPSAIAGSVVLAIDVSPMSTRSAIAVAGLSTNGGVPVIGQRKTHLSIVHSCDGMDGLMDKVLEIKQRCIDKGRPIRGVVLDDAGPAGELVQPLRLAGIEPTLIGARSMAHACGGLYTAVKNRTITHMGDPVLLAALRGAAKRDLGDAWAWRRRASTTDITPLVAATLARWGDLELPEQEAAEILVSWG